MTAADEVPQDQQAAEEKPAAPFLTVVKGSPSDEDVAVLTAVIAAAAGNGGGPAQPEPRNSWGRPVDKFRPSWGMPTSFIHGE